MARGRGIHDLQEGAYPTLSLPPRVHRARRRSRGRCLRTHEPPAGLLAPEGNGEQRVSRRYHRCAPVPRRAIRLGATPANVISDSCSCRATTIRSAVCRPCRRACRRAVGQCNPMVTNDKIHSAEAIVDARQGGGRCRGMSPRSARDLRSRGNSGRAARKKDPLAAHWGGRAGLRGGRRGLVAQSRQRSTSSSSATRVPMAPPSGLTGVRRLSGGRQVRRTCSRRSRAPRRLSCSWLDW